MSIGVGSFATTMRQFSPRLLLAELLLKRWFEPVVPFTVMIGLWAYFARTIPDYASVQNSVSLMRLFAEFGFVVTAMAFCIIAGGIDLSIGANFAMCNFAAQYFVFVREWPAAVAMLATLLIGALLGSINGLLVGFLKTRPFLTTLVTLIIVRASVDLLNETYSQVLATSSLDNDAWDFIGGGSVLGIPINAATLLIVLIVCQIFLSRSRYGWHLIAIGASRRAARHAGIRVRSMQFMAYVLSGTLCAAGGLFYAARQASTDSTTGVGWEFQALTAVVLGGVSIAGGKGTIWGAMIGALIIFLLINGLVRMGIPGYVTSGLTGLILLVAAGTDVRWSMNLGGVIQRIYVNPIFVPLASAPSVQRGSASPYAQNDRLTKAQAIGLDQVEGPEDVILDRQGRVYGSARDGNVIRFSGPNFETREVFAHIGGRPLGMQFDRDENLIVAVAGMGVYGVAPDGHIFKITDATNRTWYKLNDDSRLRMADDLDIAPDGKIYFSDCTTRYEMATNVVDILEGRPNGRVICYDPATKTTRTVISHFCFPNGICVSHDGKSVLIASTSLCKVFRYWIEGPNKRRTEILIDELPGTPDNINRASDGTYWLALIGIRTPTFDLAARKPGFRLRMVRKVPSDEWLVPSHNHGCVLKFNENGEALESWWDPTGIAHSSLTSMREHKGYLYLGGLENNRIGRIKLDGVDDSWTGYDAYWGAKSRVTGRVTT
ncbi:MULTISPECIES: ABC transporter permease [unclassified Bradyrhizobium]|uniref:ABC transporter permease n=1 Tax=Bradyrhizobium sp. USDA 4541 TaxID=2817704 RepID=UPI0020A35B43|nr:SMP-30/gluconolactonase/LRE family protein [Bradyrhizobium sp. USDA 4541]MCP1848150.1 ribose transport system permease protein [Bradyrhizobium sp. USDA 4541]